MSGCPATAAATVASLSAGGTASERGIECGVLKQCTCVTCRWAHPLASPCGVMGAAASGGGGAAPTRRCALQYRITGSSAAAAGSSCYGSVVTVGVHSTRAAAQCMATRCTPMHAAVGQHCTTRERSSTPHVVSCGCVWPVVPWTIRTLNASHPNRHPLSLCPVAAIARTMGSR